MRNVRLKFGLPALLRHSRTEPSPSRADRHLRTVGHLRMRLAGLRVYWSEIANPETLLEPPVRVPADKSFGRCLRDRVASHGDLISLSCHRCGPRKRSAP